ncbi:hypothetical protein HUW46_09332 [Amycolatopsis sp. CA-230715]|nr:hypothetical protein HUW46_09332 [Amycolatopsis sp. CA-230715]
MINEALQFFVVGLLLFSLSLAIGAPLTLRAAEQVDLVPNLTHLLGNVFTMAAACCLLVVSTIAPEDRRDPARAVMWHVGFLVICVTTMVLLFWGSSSASRSTLAIASGDEPVVAPYLTIYGGYLAWATLVYHSLGRRYFQASLATPVARTGFRLTLLGFHAGSLWLACSLLELIAPPELANAVPAILTDSNVWGSVCAILVAIGTVYPEIRIAGRQPIALAGPRPAYCRPRLIVALVQLHLLWRPLVKAFPEVVAELDNHDCATRLYRRVIEIRDAQLRLAPYVPPAVRALVESMPSTRGESGNDSVLLEAARLAVGLDAYRVAPRSRYVDRTTDDHSVHPGNMTDPLDEARYLVGVAVAFRWSRSIRNLRRRMRLAPESPLAS